jgi:hypothetical protein
MARLTKSTLVAWVAVSVCGLVWLGCGGGRATLPATVDVTLPDGSTVSVEQGGGAASLANSTWRFLRVAGNAQGVSFLTINFGPDGGLQSFENNTIASAIFGDTILFDGEVHST